LDNGSNPHLNSESKDPLKAKKMGLGLEMKRSNNAETQKKVEDMLETLKKSDHAHLFNQLLAKDDALYEKYGKNQMTLSFIELNIKMGRY
jgi:hypothetical protein